MQLSSDVLNKTVQFLEQHEESLRIKKLIFCLCKKYWENDPNILNSFSLEDLVKELLQAGLTIDQITFSLYKLVKTLNRPKVYAGVAKLILDQLGQFYNSQNDHSQMTSVKSVNKENIEKDNQALDANSLVDKIVSNLDNHQEQSRIKKIIFALATNHWESRIEVIESYGFKKLILEIRQLYSSKGELEAALKKIVENLNKQSLYVPIASIIFKQLELLYNNLQEIEIAQERGTKIFDAQIVKFKNSSTAPPGYGELPSAEYSELTTSIVDFNSEQMVTELKQIQQVQPIQSAISIPSLPSVQSLQTPPSRKTYDLFELRLEIMQYTNPLRAKILLFSILYHPWDRSGQDWSMLRSYSLDDLLEQLILARKPVAEIETKLYSIAKSLSDPDAQMQTASTIIEAVKSFL